MVPVCLLLSFLTSASCLAQVTATQTPPETATDRPADLPIFLLKVPGGTAQMGLPVREFVKACSQAVYPFNPKRAHRDASEKFKTTLRQSASMLGRKAVHVEPFYLSKWPVKNSEYVVYIDKLRQAKVDITPPLHWWRDGCPEDYAEHLPTIRAEFPKNSLGAHYYLERHGHKLPYQLLDKKGESIAEHPVVYVSWREANTFAASIGMRLPTEAELTRAMRGDSARTWPGGANTPDVYTEDMLELLGMAKPSQQCRKPAGTVAGAIGPYGHVDMYGQVWQLVGDLGFGPLHNMPTFLKCWGEIQRHPTGNVLQIKPPFTASMAIVKGGSYLSHGEPATLMLDSRVRVGTSEPLKSVGFRLAKSVTPGYDFLYSLKRVTFDTGAFAKEQALVMERLIGSEQYTLAANGFPSDYEAIAFAPVNWLIDATKTTNPTLKKAAAASQHRPLLIGALATTAAFDNGTEPGLYSVLYRQAGIPRELQSAVKAGHKELVRAKKAAAKKARIEAKADIKGKPAEQKQQPMRKWRLIAKKFGLSDADVIAPSAKDGDLGYIYVDGVKVPTDRDAFLLSTHGKTVSVLPGTRKAPAKGAAIANTIAIAAPGQGKSLAKLRFGIPLTSRDAAGTKNVVIFDLHALIDHG
jgi:formylglycine-generating enzyme required for sulfatase activity